GITNHNWPDPITHSPLCPSWLSFSGGNNQLAGGVSKTKEMCMHSRFPSHFTAAVSAVALILITAGISMVMFMMIAHPVHPVYSLRLSYLYSRGNSLARSEEHTSELQSLAYLVCRLLL